MISDKYINGININSMDVVNFENKSILVLYEIIHLILRLFLKEQTSDINRLIW